MVRSLVVLILALNALTASAQAAPGAEIASVDTGGGDGAEPTYTPMPPSPSPSGPSDSATAARGPGTLLAGRTLERGNAVVAQFGWPGISFEYLHAQTRTVDLGGEFTFNYGREGLVQVNPGIKLQGVLRLMLLDTGKLNFGLRFDPGLVMYFNETHDEGTAFGLALPIAASLGVSAGDALMLHFGMDIPLLVRIVPTDAFRVELPFLFGVGMEYRIDSHLSLLFDCRFGPDALVYSDHTDTEFAFRALLGIGYRL